MVNINENIYNQFIKKLIKMEMIKSTYIFKKIFTYLDEEIKLKLIKYNKNIQSKINISILNYKYFNGNYIIYETKLKGKEYYGKDNLLIYEGEFKNGERNGKGKEYDKNGKLKFEGEYLNGKRNGKGKEYNTGIKFKLKNNKDKNKDIKELEEIKDDILLFEGEYLNGKRNGKGKEYDDEGKIKFEGEYLNGERNGRGKEYNKGELLFEGEYLNGERNGKGKLYGNTKLIFEGEFRNDKKWIGKLENYNVFGHLKETIYFNHGKTYIKNIDSSHEIIYKGEYLNGIRNGKGKEYKNKELIFEGE